MSTATVEKVSRLEQVIAEGRFDWRKHQALIGSSADLADVQLAELQQSYRLAIRPEQRRAIASEFEIVLRRTEVAQLPSETATRTPCRCPACVAGLEPFTVPHYRAWARELELDNGKPYVVEAYFEEFLADYFVGTPENWLIVPEGNAKTTNLAGLALYLLEHRVLAAIPWAASSRDQAGLGYTQAAGFVERSPRLRQIIKCQEGYRRIKNLVTTGRIQIFAADDATGDGIIPTDAFLDELHRHKDLSLYRTWRGKLEKRGAQMAAISTAGEPGSEFEETREAIRQTTDVVEQRPGYTHCRDESIALHEWAVDAKDAEDMQAVKSANPASFITVAMLARKRASSTMTLQHWLRFVCNVATRSVASAVTEAEWADARVRADRDPHVEIPDGEPVWLGLDVAWKWDTTALVPLWVPDPEFRLFGPATILEPPRDGTSLNPDLVEQALLDVHERNPIHTVVMDTNKAEQLAAWIADELGAEVVDRAQTNAFQVLDYQRFTEALREGWLRHAGDKGLARHVLNAVARELPGGDERFDRPTASRRGKNGQQGRRVIDALTAAAMVHTTAAAELVGGAEPWTEVWEEAA